MSPQGPDLAGQLKKNQKCFVSDIVLMYQTCMINGMASSSHKIDTVVVLVLSVVQGNMELLKHSLQTKHF